MAELVFLRRGEEVLRVSVGETPVILGRGDQCDVSLPDPEVSRRHLAIAFQGGRCTVKDLSGKGTMISGEIIQSGEIADGADIVLGQWRALFRAGASSIDFGATDVGQQTELVSREEAGDKGSRFPAQLRIRSGAVEETHRILGDCVTIGKESSNDVVIHERFVSGKHLRITRSGNRFHAVDQQSTNGTWLGGVRIFEADLPLFSTIKIGDADVTIEPFGGSGPKGVANYLGIIGGDPSVKQLAELIERVAPSMAAVTVLGESGTGKELVARALHGRSSRPSGPFIPVNCAAISKELIESELFGHEKGAFTGAMTARRGAFEEAEGGTIFLDEMGELPIELQAKLLRVLESGEIKRVGAARPTTVDVRIVAATNRDLLALTREQKFREDLYYRLCVVPIHLSPLRSRRGDIVALAEHFIRQFSPRGQNIRLTAAANGALERHAWPGNIRELRNVIHRALLLRKGPNIDESDLTFDTRIDTATGIEILDAVPGMTLDQMMERIERQIVENTLKRFQGNRERVAKELGVARSTLFKRLKEWGLTQGDD